MHEIRSSIYADKGQETALTISAKKRARPSAGLGGSLTSIPIKRQEPRLSNQRREDRHRDVISGATLILRRRKHQVTVVNVSPGGVMIECEAIDPRIGETVEIQFPDCNRTKCAIRWKRENRLGLEFAPETTIIGSAKVKDLIRSRLGLAEAEETVPADRPIKDRSPRQRLIWKGTLHFAQESTPVRLHNISATGAMLESDWDYAIGTEVLLDLDGAGLMPAIVCWCEGGQTGVSFKKQFDLGNLAFCKPQAASSPKMVKPDYLKPGSAWFPAWDKLTLAELARTNPNKR